MKAQTKAQRLEVQIFSLLKDLKKELEANPTADQDWGSFLESLGDWSDENY